MSFAEPCNALVIRDQGANQLDRRSDEEVFELVQPIAPRRGMTCQRGRGNPGTIDEALDPRLDGNIEIDASKIDQQGDFPSRDRAQIDGTPAPPTAIDE